MALYYPKVISPSSGAVIDPTAENTFTYQIQGNSRCTGYKFSILNTNNDTVYDGTKVDISSAPLYNEEKLYVTIAANATNCSVGNAYKHKVIAYFPEELSNTLVKNGLFSTNLLNWNYGSNWTYSSGKAQCTAGSTNSINQTVAVKSGNKYRLSVVATRTAGTLTCTFGSCVKNGTFDINLDDWNYGSNWTYDTEKAKCTAGLTTPITQSIPTIVGKTYKVTVVATRTAGTLTCTFGSATGSLSISTSNTFTQNFVATAESETLTFTPDATFAGTIDDITVVEILNITSSNTFTQDFMVVSSSVSLAFTPDAIFAGTIDNVSIKLVTDKVSSQETLFWAYTTPTLSINMPSTSPYNLQYYTFTVNYTQAEGIGIKEYEYRLYDSTMTVIDTFKVIGSSKTDYPVDGLKSGETYFIQATVTNQMDVSLDSDIEEFSVSYNSASFVLDPVLTNNVQYNAIDINWSASQILGVASNPSGYQFIPQFIYSTNVGIHIDTGVNIIYEDLVFPNNFTYPYVFSPDYGYTGTLVEFDDEASNAYKLTFNGTNLIYIKNNITVSSYDISTYGLNYWIVTMQPTQIYFKFIVTSEIYPASDLYPSDTLYPVMLTE